MLSFKSLQHYNISYNFDRRRRSLATCKEGFCDFYDIIETIYITMDLEGIEKDKIEQWDPKNKKSRRAQIARSNE